ncbi:MAG TPA: hypothetical protein VGJ92_09315 [Methanocella sp.]|jgi:hypothetical protein
MENRYCVILAVTLFAALVLFTPAALAYDNVGAHRAINTAAIWGFPKTVMLNDPDLSNAQLDLTESRYGYAWDYRDGNDTTITYKYSQKVSAYRSKPLGMWLIDGGFSGDEPETPMAVRHFYDPVNQPRHLTDQMGGLNSLLIGANPNMDSISWALGNNENQFSFYHGKMYFQYALASDNPELSGYYGCAWRSVGETMHIVSDLTVPAHVRNDGHAVSEPYEQATGVASVVRYALSSPAQLDYSTSPGKRNLSNIMVGVALFTNTNFFSGDTIPLSGGKQANGEKGYALPMVFSGPKNNNYYYTLYDGREIKAYNITLASANGVTTESYAIGGAVIPSQQQILIPTAIRASEAVLDAFLPRFAVAVDGVQADSGGQGYIVNAHITHKPTGEWPANSFPDGSIKNGANIRVYHASGTANDYIVPLSANNPSTSINRISTVVPAQPGDQIVVYYDFGGYIVFSDPYTLEGQLPTVTPAPASGDTTDLLSLGPDQEASPGEQTGIAVYYNSKYAYPGPGDDSETVTGTLVWNSDAIDGAPVTKQWSYRFSRVPGDQTEYNTQITVLYGDVLRTARAGRHTVSVTLVDDKGLTCTKTYALEVK